MDNYNMGYQETTSKEVPQGVYDNNFDSFFVQADGIIAWESLKEAFYSLGIPAEKISMYDLFIKGDFTEFRPLDMKSIIYKLLFKIHYKTLIFTKDTIKITLSAPKEIDGEVIEAIEFGYPTYKLLTKISAIRRTDNEDKVIQVLEEHIKKQIKRPTKFNFDDYALGDANNILKVLSFFIRSCA